MLSAFTACPGLFYTTPAQDGILSRIRIPGGILTSEQCCMIANIADNYGGGYIDVTNRANLQIREIKAAINIEVLQSLQELGLGSVNPAVDNIRNIMTSPTAGIDTQELIDTRPLVKAWDDYITAHSHFSGLSAKFSVCFDGGGKVAVKNCVNDITLAAELPNGDGKTHDVYFRLSVSRGEKGKPPQDTGILLRPKECIPVLAALADVYLQHTDPKLRRKPRLREIINGLGVEQYLQEVEQQFKVNHSDFDDKLFFSHSLLTAQKPEREKFYHLGIYPQRQTGLFYIGVVLPLGRLKSWQMRGLANLATKYGSCNLRLTPWQNVLITDIPQHKIAEVTQEITQLGLNISSTHINSALVACSGKRGCAASATETKDHALALAAYLENNITLDYPINIHFSGCVKSCAQHDPADITLIGVSLEVENKSLEGYQVYVSDGTLQKFGYQLYEYVTFTELPKLISRMLQIYQHQRLSLDESFREFVYRYGTSQLLQIFS
ncbi:precorrin-3B synthase [Anabaena azotica]|uniref:precorrin-3B synthase n=1 Tax=Anabaena azotica TaxID=197653 RepID=UPI0039A5A39A